MSKIQDFLNTTKGAPLPDFEGGDAIYANLPSIGDILPSPSAKYIEEGLNKFDLLLADGSLVDIEVHPILHEKLNIPDLEDAGSYTEYIIECVHAGANRTALDPDEVSEPTWDANFGETYGKGIGAFAFEYSSLEPSTTLSETIVDFSDVFFHSKLNLFGSTGGQFNSFCDLTMKIYDSLEVLLYTINTRNVSKEMTMATAVGAGPLVDKPTVGAGPDIFISGRFTAELGAMDWLSLRTDNHTPSFTDIVDLSDAQTIRITGFAVEDSFHADRWAGMIGRRVSSLVYLPLMSSLDPLCPYRIVSDLTGE